jgi:glutaredoxin
MYVIIKHVKMNDDRKRVPVIILNGHHEVWEFDTIEDAEEMKEIFQTNSDSGHVYEVKKI